MPEFSAARCAGGGLLRMASLTFPSGGCGSQSVRCRRWKIVDEGLPGWRPTIGRWSLKRAVRSDIAKGDSKTETRKKAAAQQAPAILCRQCLQPVTSTAERVSVDGAHRHVFANPHGLVFEIGCFARVFNCATSGPATGEFTWFAGHTWQIVLCASCRTHLGWAFDSVTRRFHGLITARLIEPG